MISLSTRAYRDQFEYQREHCKGTVLNVGCNSDGANLRRDFGALNVDVRDVDQATGEALPVDTICDARHISDLGWVYDSVILGDILEHFERAEGVKALIAARRCLASGGQVVITIPHDRRRASGELPEPEGEAKFYAPGVYAYHYRLISRREIIEWIQEAGLEVVSICAIFYPWGEEGSGIIAKVPASKSTAISQPIENLANEQQGPAQKKFINSHPAWKANNANAGVLA